MVGVFAFSHALVCENVARAVAYFATSSEVGPTGFLHMRVT